MNPSRSPSPSAAQLSSTVYSALKRSQNRKIEGASSSSSSSSRAKRNDDHDDLGTPHAENGRRRQHSDNNNATRHHPRHSSRRASSNGGGGGGASSSYNNYHHDPFLQLLSTSPRHHHKNLPRINNPDVLTNKDEWRSLAGERDFSSSSLGVVPSSSSSSASGATPAATSSFSGGRRSRRNRNTALFLDEADPNYDSEDSESPDVRLIASPETPPLPARMRETTRERREEDVAVFASEVIDSSRRFPVTPRVKQRIDTILNEFFVSPDADDLVATLREGEMGPEPIPKPEFVRRLIIKAMERHPREREAASRLLSHLTLTRCVSSEEVCEALDRLLATCGDLSIDIPGAEDLLARFVARAVSDEVIPPAYLTRAATGEEVMKRARTLLSIRRAGSRMSRVWGTPEDLKEEVKALLSEYRVSGDVDEAVSCVNALNAPHYHHEVVRRAVIMSLDGRQRERAMMATLIYELYANNVVSASQIALGFQRLADELDDLQLDSPSARAVLSVFFDQAVKDGILPASRLPVLQ